MCHVHCIVTVDVVHARYGPSCAAGKSGFDTRSLQKHSLKLQQCHRNLI